MQEADGTPPTGRDTAGRQVEIGGNAMGPVVAGDHNLVVDAQHGSTVTVLMERERPHPVRRPRVELLPRPQREPIGRAAELAALAAGVRAGGLVQLYGPPGIGTSMLLRHAARHLPPGPDGVLYLNAAARETGDLAQEVFEACYDAAGFAPSETELRRLMAGVRVTVYLDNSRLGREELLSLADSARDATFVLAGSERSLLGTDGTTVEVKGLDRHGGIDLLAQGLGRPLLDSDLAAAEALWEAGEGRPLPLLRAAGLAGLADFDPDGPAQLPQPGQVAALVPLLLGRLDPPAVKILHLLATLGDAELAPAQIAAVTEVTDAAEICTRLAGLGLVLAEGHGYRCASGTATAVYQSHPEPFSVDQICRYFARWAGLPGTSPAQVADHGTALERAAALAEAVGRPDLAVLVTRAASPVMARALRFGSWARLLGLGWVSARSAGDKQAEAYFTHEEGVRSLLTGRRVMAAVLLGEAVTLWHQLGNTHGASAALHAQSYVPPLTPPAAAPVPAPAPASPAPTVHDGGSSLHTHAATTHGTHASAAHATTTPAAHASAAHAGTATPAAHTAHASAATHTTAHTTAYTAAHTSAAAHATTGHTAAAHMSSLAHGSAGHAASAVLPHAAGHAAAHAAGHAAAAGAAAAGTAGAGGAAGATGVAAAVSAKAALTAVLVLVAAAMAVAIGVVPKILDDSSSADTKPTSLAGVWETPAGALQITASGNDTFTMTDCGTSIALTGSGGHSYTGTFPVHDKAAGECGPSIGQSSVTIALTPDLSTANVTMGHSSDPEMTCYACGTWTRLSPS
ncbi:ATP-binding protein [Kitasatospora sp. McL0602]|uniref:ATP-binding protein n=1 Tax=Kitasatospora sp. McL0602 TaxID=3439530 RepID=UPI003F8A6B91